MNMGLYLIFRRFLSSLVQWRLTLGTKMSHVIKLFMYCMSYAWAHVWQNIYERVRRGQRRVQMKLFHRSNQRYQWIYDTVSNWSCCYIRYRINDTKFINLPRLYTTTWNAKVNVPFGAHFINVDWLQSQHAKVIRFPVKCDRKLSIPKLM